MRSKLEDMWLKLELGTTVLVFKSDEMYKLQRHQGILSIDSSIQSQCKADLSKIKNQQLKI
jgi:hypothetical protein